MSPLDTLDQRLTLLHADSKERAMLMIQYWEAKISRMSQRVAFLREHYDVPGSEPEPEPPHLTHG